MCSFPAWISTDTISVRGGSSPASPPLPPSSLFHSLPETSLPGRLPTESHECTVHPTQPKRLQQGLAHSRRSIRDRRTHPEDAVARSPRRGRRMAAAASLPLHTGPWTPRTGKRAMPLPKSGWLRARSAFAATPAGPADQPLARAASPAAAALPAPPPAPARAPLVPYEWTPTFLPGNRAGDSTGAGTAEGDWAPSCLKRNDTGAEGRASRRLGLSPGLAPRARPVRVIPGPCPRETRERPLQDTRAALGRSPGAQPRRAARPAPSSGRRCVTRTCTPAPEPHGRPGPPRSHLGNGRVARR